MIRLDQPRDRAGSEAPEAGPGRSAGRNAQGRCNVERPVPDATDIPYGPHPRNVLDLWKADSTEPTPLWVWIHGGGFMGGDKRFVPPAVLTDALAAGISVAAINYRLSQQAPFPAPMHDAARAIQFLRFRGRHGWNLDPARLAAGGGSAGGGISLWLGFHDDLAEPNGDDLVATESTRPTCMACTATQSSYDPNFIRTIIPGPAYQHEALQLLFRVTPADFQTPRARERFAAGSALPHARAGAPPVFLFYPSPNLPLTDALTAEQGIHHPKFGEVLKEKLDALGVECVLRFREDLGDCPDAEVPAAFAREAVQFLRRQFGLS
jgi:acetyl esterase/lipase